MTQSIEKKNTSCEECDSDDTFHFDPFKFGDLVDEHMDTEIDEDALSKRIVDAMEMARKLGGHLPGGIEGDLDQLMKPKLTWQDFVRFLKARKKQVERKNDWSSPKRKPLFAGLYVPKKNDYTVRFLLAYDCSGSMSRQQITYGVSQVTALDEKGEGFVVPWDSEPFYDAMVKVKSARPEELKNAKFKGGGGTVLMPVFETYEKQIGKVDIIIIVSDFYIADENQIMNLKKPEGTEVIWLSVKGNPRFKPPFGRLFPLEND
jgi:predicted metal-dependent peptidase